MAAVLVALMALFFVNTLVRLGGAVAERAL